MVGIRIDISGLSTGRIQHGPPSIPPNIRRRSSIPSKAVVPRGTTPTKGRSRSNLVIEQVLRQGRVKEKEITEMLNKLMEAGLQAGMMPEFDRLTEQLGEVQQTIKNALGRLGR